MSSATITDKGINLERAYLGFITVLGIVGAVFSAYRLHDVKLDAGYFLLALVAITTGGRMTIKIPNFRSHLSPSDAFVFLAMLLYGGEAAILLAGAEAVSASFSFSRKPATIMFNGAVGVISTTASVWALRLIFGRITSVPPGPYDGEFLSLLCLMALVQFIVNTLMVAVGAAIKDGKSVFAVWMEHYPWCSVSCFASAATAGVVSRMVFDTGWYAMVLAFPIVAIVYLSYRTYGRNLEAKAECERLLKQSEEANRLKDEFLSTLSHELRTPLTSILGWCDIVKLRADDPQINREALETIDRNGRAQLQLVNDLLDINRITCGKLLLEITQVDLAEVAVETVKVVQPAARAKHIEITVGNCCDSPLVEGDLDRLRQVVWNLLSNAVKFTPEGGRIWVSVTKEGSRVNLSVKDTGQGISPEFLPYVFDRFRQADGSINRRHNGLGLGLSIAKHLIEMHGGTVKAESEGIGLGSEFSLSLPLSAIRFEEHPLSNSGEYYATGSLSGVKIIVTDDETDARKLIRLVLSDSGAEVRECASAAETLDVLRFFKPHVLLSDIGMPMEDGYELIRKIRLRGETFPAAALTAYARDEDRERALSSGFQAHVSKPILATELVKTVRRLAGRSIR